MKHTLTALALALAIATPVASWAWDIDVAPDNTQTIAAHPQPQNVQSGIVSLHCHGNINIVRMQSNIAMHGVGQVVLLNEQLWATFFQGKNAVGTIFMPVVQLLTNTALMNGFRYNTYMAGQQEFDCGEFPTADTVEFVGVDNVVNSAGPAVPVVMGLTVETTH